MKILLINIGLYMGGAERQICDLADKFVEKGHEVKIIALLDKTPTVEPLSDKVKIKMLGFERNKSKSLLILWKSFFEIKNVIKDYRPDVVHSHMYHCNILTRFMRIFVNIPCLINTVHSRHEGGKLRMMLYRLTDFLTDITTNVSQDATKDFYRKKAVPNGRMITINNGINTDKFKPVNIETKASIRKNLGLTSGSKMILAVGRLTLAKDYNNLFNAFALLKVKFPLENLNLFVAGSGELESELKNLVDKLSLNNNIHFLGIRRDTAALMSTADIYVMSSAWEGLPLVIGEAMSCGAFVVSTDAGGVSEWLGGCGLVVPVKDPSLLAGALETSMLMSELERQQSALKGRKRVVENYSIESVSNVWLDLYTKHLQGK